MRTFLRHFPRYRNLADSGRVVRLVDGCGRRFMFAADKPRSFVGAGKHLAPGRPLSAAPVPRAEWGDNY